MKIKRIIAYIIDITLVSFITQIILAIPIFSYDLNKYENYYNEYIEIYTETEEISDQTIEELYTLMYDMSYISKITLIIQAITTFSYFGIIAYMMNGQTLGKRIMKLKVVSVTDEELNPNLFILRSVILTNLIPSIISILSIYLLKQNYWIIVETITSYLQIFITFILIGFIIFREDERSLHDLICKTKVIEYKNAE